MSESVGKGGGVLFLTTDTPASPSCTSFPAMACNSSEGSAARCILTLRHGHARSRRGASVAEDASVMEGRVVLVVVKLGMVVLTAESIRSEGSSGGGVLCRCEGERSL